MASKAPFAQLTGTWKFWIAAMSTAIPDLDAVPPGAWAELGATDGDQSMQWLGSLTMFSDNNTTGPRKHVRPEEGFNVGATLVNLTLEDIARVLSMDVAEVTTTTSGALSVKNLPLKRGFIPNCYAILARGGAVVANNTMSGYLAAPAQLWIPRGVFDGEPTMSFSKSNRPGIQFQFVAEVDDTQPAGYEFGYLMMQES